MNYKRVHGDIEIKRKSIKIDNYKKAKPFLIQDFHNICGYCGKCFDVTLTDSQIDHFKPKSKFPELENDYQNLVLSCFTCNNKKRDDWPSNSIDTNISLDGLKGYVDPASEDFDKNLARTSNGDIVGLTNIGNYMVKRLNFQNRPIKECYRAQELCLLIEKLRSKSVNNPLLCDLMIELYDIRKQLFISKEK